MLEDFIEVNQLEAKIVRNQKLTHRITCKLFLADENPILLVYNARHNPDLHVVKEHVTCTKFTAPDTKKTLEITGYEKDFIPPISIFGVDVFVDKHLFNGQILSCPLSEREFLEITAEEIEASNQDCMVLEFAR
jgi:hypothetical protein